MATPLYAKNFDADTVGTNLVEWVSVSGNWVVSVTGAVSSPNALRNTGAADGQVVVLDATKATPTFTALADGVETYSQVVQAGVASAYALACPLARSNLAATQNYLYLITGTVGGTVSVQLLAKVPGVNSGNYVPKGTTQVLTGVSFAVGDQVYIKHREIGTSFAFKIWKVGAQEPASYQGAWTDATIAAAGFYGRYQSTNGSTTVSTGFDDVTITTATTDVPADSNLVNYYLRSVPSAGKVLTVTSGLFFEAAFTGDLLTLLFDTSNGPVADLEYQINRNPVTRITGIPATQQITIPVTNGKGRTNVIRLWTNVFEGTSGNTALWQSGTGGVRFAGFRLIDGEGLVALPRKEILEVSGTSVTATVRINYTGGASDQTVMSSANGHAQVCADLLGMAPSAAGYGATSINAPGNGGVPGTIQNFPLAMNGATWTPAAQPVAVLLEVGTNVPTTQQNYQDLLTLVRSLRPYAVIACEVPNTQRTSLLPLITAAVAAVGDQNVIVLDPGPTLSQYSPSPGEDYNDTLGHMSFGGHQKLGMYEASMIGPAIKAKRVPAPGKVAAGTVFAFGTIGTRTDANPANVLLASGRYGDPADQLVPSLTIPSAQFVLKDILYGPGGTGNSGRYYPPDPSWMVSGAPAFGLDGLAPPTALVPDVSSILVGSSKRIGGTVYPGTAQQTVIGGSGGGKGSIGI